MCKRFVDDGNLHKFGVIFKNDMNRTLKQLLSGEHRSYIVGGSVRDMILDLSPTDYDLAVPDDPAAFSDRISKKISGRVVRLGKPGKPLFRIISSKITLDVSGFKGSSIREDLLQRDFTVNAMAYDPSRNELIDPCGGQEDLFSGLIRMVSDTAFQNDPIRLIRAYRLAATLSFRIDEDTQRAIRKQASLIRAAAGERVREELIRLLESPSSARHIDRMEASGLLFSIFPELSGFKGSVDGPGAEPGFDSPWNRFRKGYRHLETLLDASDSIREAIDCFQPALLKLAFLLHDIGNPSTPFANGNEGDRQGEKRAGKADEICRRLRLSNRERKFVSEVISYHREPFSLFLAHRKRTLTTRNTVIFFMACGDTTPAILLHALAEFRTEEQPENEGVFDAFIRILSDRFFGQFQPERKAPPLLTGDDLIRAFGLASSPMIGLLLDRIEVARLAHEVSTREGALSLAKKILSEET
jgi:tRNA nucleotidyltransferase/poly(A) polymerase